MKQKIIKNKKYLIICSLIFILFSFITTLKAPNMLKAYQTSTESSYGSYPIKFNKDKYYDINLLETPNVSLSTTQYNVNYKVENNTFYVDAANYIGHGQGPIFYNNLNLTLEPGTYTLQVFELSTNDRFSIYIGVDEWDTQFPLYTTQNYNTITLNQRTTFNYLRCWTNNNYVFSFKLMLYKGEYNSNLEYSIPFKFGYNIGAYYNLTNLTNNTISSDAYFNFCPADPTIICQSSKYTKLISNDIVINANASKLYYYNNIMYIPYDINNDNVITFNHNMIFNTFFTDNQVRINSMGIDLVPIFQGTLKDTGESVNYIDSDFTYLYNSISLNGIKLTSYESNYIEGSNLKLINDEYNQFLSLDNNVKYYITNGYNLLNINTNNKINTDYYFTKAYNISIQITDINSLVQILTIDSFNALVVGNDNISAPTINNNGENYEQYNTCSAWYDLPCQISNGITYAIYNLPIVSNLFTLFNTFISGIHTLVTMIKWYEGFGIIFSVFVFIMLIRIIIMLLKGSNDDRGNKK